MNNKPYKVVQVKRRDLHTYIIRVESGCFSIDFCARVYNGKLAALDKPKSLFVMGDIWFDIIDEVKETLEKLGVYDANDTIRTVRSE